MGLRGASPPLSQLTGFLNKIAIPCTSNWSLDPLACRAESSTALTTVTATYDRFIRPPSSPAHRGGKDTSVSS